MLTSSIARKYVVAITGVLLLLFVIGHLLGNLQVFIGQDADAPFTQAQRIPLSPAPYGSGAPVTVADYNQDGHLDLWTPNA